MTIDDVKECISLYIVQNQEHMLPSDYDTAVKTMITLIKRGAYCKVLKVDGKIRAWLLAIETQKEFVKQKAFQQIFFGSDLQGIQAYRAVVDLHNAMIDEALRRKIYFVLSTGSNQDTNNTFTKILGKNGWNVSGYLATRILNEIP